MSKQKTRLGILPLLDRRCSASSRHRCRSFLCRRRRHRTGSTHLGEALANAVEYDNFGQRGESAPCPQLHSALIFKMAAGETDFRPSRMAVVTKQVEAFIREFFDQNHLSQIGLVTIKDGIAQCVTDLSSSPESHTKALMGKLRCSGDSSLQNSLDLVHDYLNQIPTFVHCEVLKIAKIRCSVIGISAELFICKHLCQETGGSYSVALNDQQLKELVLEHAPPPPAIAEFAKSNLIKMGFPQRGAKGIISICSYHKEAKSDGCYTCPRCKAWVCELPTKCCICGLTLVSSPHFARSYRLVSSNSI